MYREPLISMVLLAVLTVAAGCPPKYRPQPPFPQPTLQQTVHTLASDDMEGRGVGTAGLDQAAQYIAGRFARANLLPLPGDHDYFHTFDFVQTTGIDPATSLQSAAQTWKLGDDFTAAAFSHTGDFAGPVVFAGYGINAPDIGYDDYADIDVEGKIVLVFRYEPHHPDGTSRLADSGWSPHAHFDAKIRAAQTHGAQGILLVNPPNHHGLDELIPFSPAFSGRIPPLPFLHIRQFVADALLERGGLPDLQALQGRIDSSGAPASMPLEHVQVHGTVALHRTITELKNVAGYLPGVQRDQYVVVGAHYDHLGRGGPGSLAPHGNAIHNGADDNASGTAAILAIADRLAIRSSQEPLERSVVFVAFTAEERGLIGSMQFVDDQPIPLADTVAMLNLDMVGRVRNDVLYVGGIDTAEPFEQLMDQVDRTSPLQFKYSGGGIGPSDHAAFAMKRVPVLFFFSGLHSDYHRPTDDPEKINYAGLHNVVEAGVKTVIALTEMPHAPYIASADAPRAPTSAETRRVTLGVIPDYGSDQATAGVRISGTTPGSPADRAGLLGGDIITTYNDRPIENLYDLTDALAQSKPGDPITLTITRNGQTKTFKATLAPRD